MFEANVIYQNRLLDIKESVVDLEYLKFMKRLDLYEMSALKFRSSYLKRDTIKTSKTSTVTIERHKEVSEKEEEIEKLQEQDYKQTPEIFDGL